jgi:outer membrane protein OmpA-like peptidoglycan-associated protein
MVCYRTLLLSLVLTTLQLRAAHAGDPAGVTDVLRQIRNNWPDAQFSIDPSGFSDGDAIIEQPLQVEYEAAQPGYLTYVRISSHGDISVMRPGQEAKAAGTLPVPIQPPLGPERALFLYSNQPLDRLWSVGQNSANLGSDRAHAEALVQKLNELEAQGVRIASRRLDYMVNAPAGQTQYTTRGIIRQVEGGGTHAGTAGARPRFPTRIEFELNSDQLTPQSKRDLDVFGAAVLTKLRDRSLTLEGHTDATGTDDYNQTLSERRASVARQYLVDSFNLSADKIRSVGKGKGDPIAPNDTEADRSKNRRVDFVFAAPADAIPGK